MVALVLTYPGLQSGHPYGVSDWCDWVASGGAEKVEGFVMRCRRSVFVVGSEFAVAQEFAKPCFEVVRKLSNGGGTSFMGIIINRILAACQPMGHVPQDLVAVCLHEKLSEAKHTLTCRWPRAALARENVALLGRQLFQRGKIVKERVLRPKLYPAAQQPKSTSASKEPLV